MRMPNHSNFSEQRIQITAEDEARVVASLDNDVGATLGGDYGELIRQEAAGQREFANGPNVIDIDVEDYERRVAEYVQQEFLDSHIDTTWPTCPFHTRHPLWVHNRQWVCEQLGALVAPIGGLRTTRSSDGSYRILINEGHDPTA
jgi:hypothetical protein